MELCVNYLQQIEPTFKDQAVKNMRNAPPQQQKIAVGGGIEPIDAHVTGVDTPEVTSDKARLMMAQDEKEEEEATLGSLGAMTAVDRGAAAIFAISPSPTDDGDQVLSV